MTLWINTVGTGRGFQGLFGACDVFGGSGGRGHGFFGSGQSRKSPHTPYRPASASINIKIEALQYPREESRQLSSHQKS